MRMSSSHSTSSTHHADNNGLKKGPWTPEEDEKLLHFIQENGHGSWRALPKLAGLNRCGKSCRLRWTNYLRPDIKRGKFSQEEEQTILHLHSFLGNKWSAIATHLPGRTDNEIKNFWNTHLKKKLIQMGFDPMTHRPRTDLFSSLNQILALAKLNDLLLMTSHQHNLYPFEEQLASSMLLQTDNEAINDQYLANIQYLQNLLRYSSSTSNSNSTNLSNFNTDIESALNILNTTVSASMKLGLETLVSSNPSLELQTGIEPMINLQKHSQHLGNHFETIPTNFQTSFNSDNIIDPRTTTTTNTPFDYVSNDHLNQVIYTNQKTSSSIMGKLCDSRSNSSSSPSHEDGSIPRTNSFWPDQLFLDDDDDNGKDLFIP